MRLTWAQQTLDVEVPQANLVTVRRQPATPPLIDVPGAVVRALEEPVDFPPLRRALTPDDHVAIAVDEHIPHLTQVLVPVLEHLRSAQISADAMTLICLPPSSGQAWIEELPEEFQDVHIEVHEPGDRRKLSYLATTRKGRRIYLNRTAVDADQLILLTRRGFDPYLGVTGAELALFPALADDAVQREVNDLLAAKAPGAEAQSLRQEAVEVAWLLGAPFLVQVIEGDGDQLVHVVSGPIGSGALAEQLLQAKWHVEVERSPDLVIATLGGDPARQSFDDVARAFHNASRVVKPGGRIAILSAANPALDASVAVLRSREDPVAALKVLLKEKPPGWTSSFLWGGAAQRAKLYLLSGMAAEIVEELFTTPLEQAEQVHKLVGKNDAVLFLPDAHKVTGSITDSAPSRAR